MYGCELWTINNNGNIDLFCIAWRKALRRVLNLPFNTHSRLLSILADTIPIFDEICKQSARFITACLSSPSRLVQSVSWHSVVFGKFSSPLGSNAMLCCFRYGWSFDSFVLNLVQLFNSFFHLWYRDSLPDIVIYTVMSLLELHFIREGQFTLPGFAKSQITSLITALATAKFYSIDFALSLLSSVLFICVIVHFCTNKGNKNENIADSKIFKNQPIIAAFCATLGRYV
jgi:hypothetical protein